MEDQLVQLAEHMPHRYQRAADNAWVCPPGEAYAQPLGFFYRIQSSAQIDWVYQRNLRFLEDYLRFSRLPVEEKIAQSIRTCVMRRPALTLLELLEGLQAETVDDVYFLIATDQLYVDLSQAPLAQPEHVQVFVDREQADAYTTLSQSSVHLFPGVSSSSVPLTQARFSGGMGNPGEFSILVRRPLRCFLPRNTCLISLLRSLRLSSGKEKSPLPLPSDNASRWQNTRYSPKPIPSNWKSPHNVTNCWDVLAEGTSCVPRTLQRWRAEFHMAEAVYGHGFTGLIPRWSNSGNRLPRLSQSIEQLIEKYISEHYETHKQQTMYAVYLLLEREARERTIPVPSYTTFRTRIKQRSRHEQILKRQGPRAAR